MDMGVFMIKALKSKYLQSFKAFLETFTLMPTLHCPPLFPQLRVQTTEESKNEGPCMSRWSLE